jgi:ribose 1,5-bisphosphate isomerase
MKDLEQRIARVRDDREHGSRWLVREAISILRDLAEEQGTPEDERMRQLYHAARTLARARPAMAALACAVGRVMHAGDNAAAVAQGARSLLQDYDSATQRIARHAERYLHGRLMTCSISGTVLDVLLARRQSIERVIVLEGRPRYEGRETAQTLSKQGLALTLITDAQADIFMPDCQGVVVGADSVLADGGVLNKAGTALLAWAARGHNVPFYVLCETLKISPRRWSGDLSWLEEKDGAEVWPQSPPGITVRNFYFDHTQPELVGKLITERGVLTQQEIAAIAAEARDNESRLFNQ